MTAPIPLQEAWERLFEGLTPLPAETVPAEQAVGRYLAEPLVAARTQPAADLSAMDGYAVRADDLAGPWRLIGESAAGRGFAGQLAQGETIRISTGALMPPGNCAVLLQENAGREGDHVVLNGDGPPSARHVRRRGFDFEMGDSLLPSGTRIAPGQLALALASGHRSLKAHRLPRIAVLDSGSELVSDPARCRPDQIPASNGAMLAAMAAPHAASIARLGPVPDDHAAITAALESAASADVVVTSGGASVGDHDLIRPVLEQWGAQIDFWRVAIRPGKPLLVARRGQQWILGLPGNPVSSYVTAMLFLLPMLRVLAGAPRDAALPRTVRAITDGPLPPTEDRREFLRGSYAGGTVTPLAERDSSALRTLAAANALIDRMPHSSAVASGTGVDVYLLENGGIA